MARWSEKEIRLGDERMLSIQQRNVHDRGARLSSLKRKMVHALSLVEAFRLHLL